VICVVRDDVVMPHVHSPDAAAKRRARAVALGFLAPATPRWSFSVARRLQAVGKSLAFHEAHCQLIGQNVHSASVASALANPLTGPVEYAAARRAHRAAGKAKHDGWVVHDPLWTNDPWQRTSSSVVHSPPCVANAEAAKPLLFSKWRRSWSRLRLVRHTLSSDALRDVSSRLASLEAKFRWIARYIPDFAAHTLDRLDNAAIHPDSVSPSVVVSADIPSPCAEPPSSACTPAHIACASTSPLARSHTGVQASSTMCSVGVQAVRWFDVADSASVVASVSGTLGHASSSAPCGTGALPSPSCGAQQCDLAVSSSVSSAGRSQQPRVAAPFVRAFDCISVRSKLLKHEGSTWSTLGSSGRWYESIHSSVEVERSHRELQAVDATCTSSFRNGRIQLRDTELELD